MRGIRVLPLSAETTPASESANHSSHDVILFDGVCSLCNVFVDFVMKRDRHGRVRFASLQSEVGRRFVADFELADAIEYIVLVRDGRATIKSSAALRVCRRLRFPWPLAQVFLLVPPFIRNWVYDRIARNRYRLFGKRETCRVPTEKERERFIG